MKRFLLILYVAVLFGCGGGGGDSAPTVLGEGSFWAVNFTTTGYYVVNAAKVGEGVNCYVYLENGQTASQSAINAIITQFDTAIYTNLNTNFGSEPNPGIDNDPKIYIVLLNVADGFTPGTSNSFIAGYFDSRSEFLLPNSNQKEILFMNINPATRVDPSGTEFFATIAHEFQHMIHWEQKSHLRNIVDDTWLDEAMSQVARTYCGFGPDYFSILAYERDPNQSLINFDDTSLGNYGMVYLWAQYVKDRVGNNIFQTMLQNNLTGMNSVNAALSAAGYPRDFTGLFRDWAMANFFGDGTTVPAPSDHPEWSYISINTWPETANAQGVNLPGLFLTVNSSNLSNLNPAGINASNLTSLKPWSLGYYSYIPAAGSANGTVIWNPQTSSTSASFINGNPAGTSATVDMTPNTAFPFQTVGYLINLFTPQPPFPSSPAGDLVIHTAIAPVATAKSAITATATTDEAAKPRTPAEIMAAMNANPIVRRHVQETGKPHRVYVDSWFKEKEKELRAQGIRPPF
jgi:hypothetical protein